MVEALGTADGAYPCEFRTNPAGGASGTMTSDHQLQTAKTPASRQVPRSAGRNWKSLLINGDRAPVIAFLVHLGLVLAFASIAAGQSIRRPTVPAVGFYLQPVPGSVGHLLEPLFHWDGYWYILIADRGYSIHAATTAFWPLYPLLIKAGYDLSKWPMPILGVILSNLALLGALLVLYRLVRLDYGDAVAGRTVWLLALFPTAFFFSAVYTESLFLLLTAASIYCGRTDRWGRAAAFGFLAALTRNTGVLVIIPLGLLLIQRYGWDPRKWFHRGIQVAGVALGPLLYFAFLQTVWGDPLITLKAQQQWARYQTMPWNTFAAAFQQLDLRWLHWLGTTPDRTMLTSTVTRASFAQGNAYDLSITLLFIPIALYALWRVRPAYSLYALALFMLPLFSPSYVHALMSMPRFVIVMFPFFIALAMLLRHRWLFGAALVLSVAQFAALLIQFGTWFWVA